MNSNVMRRFDTNQRMSIENAAIAREVFTESFQIAFGIKKTVAEEYFRHFFITSEPGLGKTHEAQKIMETHTTQVVATSGRNGLPNIMIELCMALETWPEGMITVLVDDGDDLLFNPTNVDVLKGGLDPNRNVMEYNNNFVTSLIARLQKDPDLRKVAMGEAASRYTKTGSLGLRIPTERFKFIFISNKTFTGNSPKLNNTLSAVASRLQQLDFRDHIRDKEEMWGWIARIALNNQILKDHPLTEDQTVELLNYIWDKLDRIKTLDMRVLQKFALDFFDHPDNYRDRWNFKVQHAR